MLTQIDNHSKRKTKTKHDIWLYDIWLYKPYKENTAGMFQFFKVMYVC